MIGEVQEIYYKAIQADDSSASDDGDEIASSHAARRAQLSVVPT
jgi:hypothetical protein